MDRILRRTCKILRIADCITDDLTIDFFQPQRLAEDQFEATARISSKFIDKKLIGGGVDDVQAFFCLSSQILSYLKSPILNKYKIYWFEEGDLLVSDFWKYQN
jgi:hypothetical protein